MTEELQHEGEDQPHLLLVDDDPTFTRVMARAMSRRGLQVSIAGSAEKAWKWRSRTCLTMQCWT